MIKTPFIKQIYWNPPILSWLKVNTNGSSWGNLGVTGCGSVFRNCRGFVKGYFALAISYAYVFEAEIIVVINAINLVWDSSWKKLWIKVDSSFVVDLLMSNSTHVLWKLHRD